MTLRIAKIALVGEIALLLSLLTLNNILEFDSSFQILQNAVTTDSTLRHATFHAFNNQALANLIYMLVVLSQITAVLLCWVGVGKCMTALHQSAEEFDQAKTSANYGLMFSAGLWLAAFLLVGDHWSQWWLPADWNQQASALRMFIISSIGLICFAQSEQELSVQPGEFNDDVTAFVSTLKRRVTEWKEKLELKLPH